MSMASISAKVHDSVLRQSGLLGLLGSCETGTSLEETQHWMSSEPGQKLGWKVPPAQPLLDLERQ
jgi:hypothetical protein